MAGWSRKKRLAFERAFYDFLGHVFIDSKDSGPRTCLGDALYDGQKTFFTAIFDGLEQDKHDFYALKSRQLGFSTGTRAFTTFWMGMHDGLRGGVVFDLDTNRDNARSETETMVAELPDSLRFPKVVSSNRRALTLSNRSSLTFMAAGVRATASNKGLGASLGLSFAHNSEMCNWGNEAGVEAYRHSLSDVNPDRLYIWESTGRGYNMWHDMWTEARENPDVVCCFLGWWSKNTQRIERKDPRFERFGVFEPGEVEKAKMDEVRRRYGVTITPEQLAWIRWKMTPAAHAQADELPDFSGSVERLQEQAWTEDDSFQMTAATFFEPVDLTEIADRAAASKFRPYTYSTGFDFLSCRVYPAFNAKSVQLKVWEEPIGGSVYALGIDPAYGINENNDRSSIQVLRCYADGIDQVAEYAWSMANTKQFAWVIASLLGWYGGDGSQVHYNLELTGPGHSVWLELQDLRRQLHNSYMREEAEQYGLANIFHNVKNYLYARSDALMPARNNVHFKTTGPLKVTLMERLRDFTANRMLNIRSLATLEEMRAVTREGDTIEAQGKKKDDRVMALALAVRCWEDQARRWLMTSKRTREAEEARLRVSIVDQTRLYNRSQLEEFFAMKQAQRRAEVAASRRSSWRARR